MNCVQQVKDNLAVIIRNDTINAQRAQQAHGSQDGNFRRDVVQARNTRVDAFGDISVDDTISIATDSCSSCGKREVKLSRCKTVRQRIGSPTRSPAMPLLLDLCKLDRV
ncbi:hypothetical protein QCA50_018487 [Cerrena zonata]|uniref:Uncharacterized protein n=1 Tax=Cerrena zonata TaxID=2478898 RepID=A0AAW0FE82_9APHY